MINLYTKLREASYPRSPNIMAYLWDNWSKFMGAQDAIEKIETVFDLTRDHAIQHVDAAQDVYGKLEPVEVG